MTGFNINSAQLNVNSASIKTTALYGAEAIDIEVQAHISKGLPGFIICGLPDKAISESKDRIRSVFAHLGIAFISKRLVVNMSPANIKKEGTHYDLPIALSILKVMNLIPQDCLNEYLIIGELSLNGTITKVPGALISALHANKQGMYLICSESNVAESSLGLPSDKIFGFKNLIEIIQYLNNPKESLYHNMPVNLDDTYGEAKYSYDMADVLGHDQAKRALEIAAAAGHHMLMIGSPGVGKSMLAMRMTSILPDLNREEAMSTASIHSISNVLDSKNIFRRPFREPHHNSSMSAMLGGGQNALPGEVSLSHNGVLFMDELTLWPVSVLNGLRESLETGYITVSRANAHYKYGAKYQLIAAANPCPCGKAYDEDVVCAKLPHCSQNYLGRIPGPIVDRISIIISMQSQDPWIANQVNKSESSDVIRERVIGARLRQSDRYAEKKLSLNNEISGSDFDILDITSSSIDILNRFARQQKLSNRGYDNVRKLSRTIADLDGADFVLEPHMLEAIGLCNRI